MADLIVLLAGLLVTVIWAGGILPESWLMTSAIFVAGAIVVAAILPQERRGRDWRIVRIVLTGGLIWGILTVLPLPAGAGSMLSGFRQEAQAAILATSRLRMMKDFSPDESQFWYISMNRAGSMRGLLLLLGAVGAALLASRLSKAKRIQLAKGLLGIGMIVALGGMAARWLVAPGGAIWWWWESGESRSQACFINPNHYGAYLALLCPLGMAMVTMARRREHRRQAAGWLLCILVLAAGSFASGSRGALLLLAVGLLGGAMVQMLQHRRRILLLTMMAGALPIATAAMAQLLAPRLFLHPLLQSWLSNRVPLWQAGADMFREFPLIGVGLEGYRALQPRYMPLGHPVLAHHPESTWIELFAEGGLIGAALLAMVAIGLIVTCWRRRHHPELDSTLRRAVSAALLVVGLHALFDVAWHVPIYAYTVAAMIGLALPPGDAVASPSCWERARSAMLPALMLAAVLWIGGVHGRDIFIRDRAREIQQARMAEMPRFLAWYGANWQVWHLLAERAMDDTSSPPDSLAMLDPARDELAVHALNRAIERAPTLSPPLLYKLALLHGRQGRIAAAKSAYERYLAALPAWKREQVLEGRP